jgi:hypothetical protein
VATVSTAFFDEAEYIRDGETGFLANDYLRSASGWSSCSAIRALCRRMGGAGREAARVMFTRIGTPRLAGVLGEVTGK